MAELAKALTSNMYSRVPNKRRSQINVALRFFSQKINKRSLENHYYTVVPNKSVALGKIQKINTRRPTFIRHSRVSTLNYRINEQTRINEQGCIFSEIQ